MIWGFSDRAIAETLKTLALSIGKGPNAVPDPLRDNGSRIFVVSLPEALDPLSKNGGTDLTPSSGTAKLFKKDLSTDALALRKSGNSEEDYTVPIFNLSGHSIPETPEEPKPEDLHLAIQDSFGALYLLPEVSELFGTLAESWEPGDTEPKTITLDEGFERSEDFAPFQAFPAPTLSEGLSTGTAVRAGDRQQQPGFEYAEKPVLCLPGVRERGFRTGRSPDFLLRDPASGPGGGGG